MELPLSRTILVLFMIGLISVISYVDVRTLKIPDTFNMALAIGGIGYQIEAYGGVQLNHVLAVIAVFFSLFMVGKLFFLLKRSTGLGLGDVKMASAATLWISPLHIPQFMLIASALGIVVVCLLHLRGVRDIQRYRLPFGPFLGLALLIVWAGENATYNSFRSVMTFELAL